MKYILSISLALIIIVVTISFLSPPFYHYKGIASTSLPQAHLLIQDKGSEQSIQVFSYDAERDELYISYDFYGDKDDATTYNIPLGYPRSKWDEWGLWVIFLLIGIPTITYVTIQEWCNWGQRKRRASSPSIREGKERK